MDTSTPPPNVSSTRIDHRMPNMLPVFTRATRPIRAAAKAAIFFLKVFPMLPSRPVDWVTKPPVVERVRYPTRFGQAEGDLYRPSAGGPHPGIVVCLGVVPFGVDHPQVPRLGKALARAGFAALLYWSPAMRDFRLDPVDISTVAPCQRMAEQCIHCSLPWTQTMRRPRCIACLLSCKSDSPLCLR